MRYDNVVILRITKKMKRGMGELADRWHVKQSEIGRRAIRDFLDKHQKNDSENADNVDAVDA